MSENIVISVNLLWHPHLSVALVSFIYVTVMCNYGLYINHILYLLQIYIYALAIVDPSDFILIIMSKDQWWIQMWGEGAVAMLPRRTEEGGESTFPLPPPKKKSQNFSPREMAKLCSLLVAGRHFNSPSLFLVPQ